MWINNTLASSNGSSSNLQIIFKNKPTAGGTFQVIPYMDMLTSGTDGKVALVIIDGSKQYWSMAPTTGTVAVTVTGTTVQAVFNNVVLYNYTDQNDNFSVSGNLKIN
jgi:hypothetical protein